MRTIEFHHHQLHQKWVHWVRVDAHFCTSALWFVGLLWLLSFGHTQPALLKHSITFGCNLQLHKHTQTVTGQHRVSSRHWKGTHQLPNCRWCISSIKRVELKERKKKRKSVPTLSLSATAEVQTTTTTTAVEWKCFACHQSPLTHFPLLLYCLRFTVQHYPFVGAIKSALPTVATAKQTNRPTDTFSASQSVIQSAKRQKIKAKRLLLLLLRVIIF